MSARKILIGGDFWRGSSVDFMADAFRGLGIAVEEVNFSEYRVSFVNRAANRFFTTPHYWGTGRLNRSIVEKAEAQKPDFILLIKPTLITPATVEKLRKTAPVFSWYPDYVRFPKTASSFFYRSIPLYDVHFSFNFANSEELLKRGAKASVFLPCAADPTVHHPHPPRSEEERSRGADVVFVGTYAPEERVTYLERLCDEGYDIKIYGNGWEKLPDDSCLLRRGCVQFKALYCEEMAAIFGASKIATAFVRRHNDETLACRTFEIPACGGFLLHERTAKTGEVLEEGKEAEFFSSYEEFRDKVKYYLAHSEERARIASAGMARVAREHLFANRVRKIIDVFEGLR